MLEFDELKLYRGKGEICISPKIMVMQPSIDQIIDFGEKRYFNAVHTLTGVGADFKWQLMDYFGIDYTTIGDYELFVKLIAPAVSSKKRVYEAWKKDPEKYKKELDYLTPEMLEDMLVNPLELVLKDIDLADFVPCKIRDDEIVLYNVEQDITIDRVVYMQMVDVVRKIHGFKRNNEMPANETTKRNLIEDARDDHLAAQQKPYKSVLKPLISALTVKCGMCGDDRVFQMGINMFFDNLKRIGKIQDAEFLLQGAYSGFASLKGVDKTRLDWAGDI